MRFLRTLGVLSVTLSLVWSMTLETTSPRYLEDGRSLKISLGDIKPNSSSVAPFYLDKTSIAEPNSINDSLDLGDIARYVNNLNTSLVLNRSSTLNSSLQDASKEAAGESRKIKANKKRPINNNFVRTTIKEIQRNITKANAATKKKPASNSTTKISTKTVLNPNFKLNKLSTLAPITFKLTKPTSKRPKVSSTRKPPIKIKLTSPSSKRKAKPTIKKIITKWKDSMSTTSDLKQNWYEEGVPYPNPMPQVTSSSPPFSISDAASSTENIYLDAIEPVQIYGSSSTENIYLEELEPVVGQAVDNISPEIFSNSPSEPLQGVPPILPLSSEEDLESVAVPASDSNPIENLESVADSNPISTFNLDMLPSPDLTRDPSGSGCPSVHISSSVLSPLQRQGCSDLNLVLNTHYHQNQDTRNPAISTYDAAAPLGDDIVEAEPVVDDGLANAGPTGGIASDSVGVPTTYTGGSGGSPGGGSAGSGGSGGSGGDGGGHDGFHLPDLKPMFEALGYLMRGLGWLMQKLMNPWLYIVPIVFFFKLGFLGILTLFPWWIPFVFLYFSVRTDEPKNTVSHVKHHHKPVLIRHRDGWYWDQETQTWKDVTHQHGYERRLGSDYVEDAIDDKIIRFGDKYLNSGGGSKRRVKKKR